MRAFWNTQGQRVLTNERYACVLTTILSFLPFTEWLALVIVALVSLRKGWQKGLVVLVVSLATVILRSACIGSPYLISSFLLYVLTYCLAVLLRFLVSWDLLSKFVLFGSLLVLCIIQLWFPNFVSAQYQEFLVVFKSFGGSEVLLKFLQGHEELAKHSLANFLLGIKILGIIVSTVCSLMIARAIQSELFYPGEFRKELLAIRASKILVVALLVSINAAIYKYPLALSCLPIELAYFTAAGMSLFFNFISKNRQTLAIIMLLISFVMAPYVLIPAFVLVGCLDSLFNFRLRLLPKVNV